MTFQTGDEVTIRTRIGTSLGFKLSISKGTRGVFINVERIGSDAWCHVVNWDFAGVNAGSVETQIGF